MVPVFAHLIAAAFGRRDLLGIGPQYIGAMGHRQGNPRKYCKVHFRYRAPSDLLGLR